jgi:glycosyltransferase involved in cell wall biosynthesis
VRLAFLVERPTQFEAPFYRHATADPRHELRVLYTGTGLAEPVFDPELGHPVAWGIDLLGGYPHALLPVRGRARWLARELRRASCDLLIVNGYTRRDYLLAAWLARRHGIATALRLDSVIWDGGDGDGAGSRETARQAARRWLVSSLLTRLYDLFLGVGSLTLDYLSACGVPAARQGLFPYAVDVEHFRTASDLSGDRRRAARDRLGLPPGARAILAVAKLNARETPWDLLRALPELPPSVHLVLAGDGPDRAAAERLAAELAPGRVRWLGYVPYGELPALYAAVDLFVHAPQEERWGVSVEEALACGLPVVASSRVGAAHDLVTAGANGGTYPRGDAAALARAVTAALALDRTAVAAANRAILARWDYAASWRHLLDAAGRIMGGSPP